MKKKWYLLALILSLFLILLVGFIFNRKSPSVDKIQISPSPTIVLSPTPIPVESGTPTPNPTVAALPSSYIIDNFSFQSQAPLANWDELHNEGCEEASLILVNYYQKGQSLSAQTMDEEILKTVDWEIKKWGTHKDLTIGETAEVAEGFFGIDDWKIESNITIEDIKKEIAQNHPVIVPTAGRLLGNPYFRQPGPVYHMVVVIGYDKSNFIVQDVGTRRGDHYRYNENVLFNAIHDWNGSPDNINSGPKNMLVFY